MSSEQIDFTEMTERVKAALAGAASTTGATMLPTENRRGNYRNRV